MKPQSANMVKKKKIPEDKMEASGHTMAFTAVFQRLMKFPLTNAGKSYIIVVIFNWKLDYEFLTL